MSDTTTLQEIADKYHVSKQLVKEILYCVAYGGKYFEKPEPIEEEIRAYLVETRGK